MISYTGGGPFATARRGSADIEQIFAVARKNPRASHQALAKMTGYSMDTVRTAMEAGVPKDAPASKTYIPLPSPKAKNKSVCSCVELAVRAHFGINSSLWSATTGEHKQVGREIFTLLAVRYSGTSAAIIANIVDTDRDLTRMRSAAYAKSLDVEGHKDFRANGAAIERVVRKSIPAYLVKMVAPVFL